jgi:ribosomal protein S18 acetylase RimI-like enzyme
MNTTVKITLKHQDISVRRASIEDALKIAELHIAAWKVAYKGLVSDQYLSELNVETRAIRWRESLAKNEDNTFLAVLKKGDDHSEVVGFVVCNKCRDADLQQSTTSGEIFAIYVRPDLIGAGIGAKLMLHGEQRLKEMGFTTSFLWYLKGNAAAETFYKKFGYSDNAKTKEHEFTSPSGHSETKILVRLEKQL